MSQGILAPHDVPADLIADDLAVFHHEPAPQPHLTDGTVGDEALVGGVAGAAHHVLGAEDVVGVGIIHHEVGVGAGGNDTLAGEHAVELGGVFRQNAAHGSQRNFSRGHAEGVHQLAPSLHAGQTPGDLGKVAPTGLLLLQSEGAVVGGNGLDLALAQPCPEGAAILRLADGRRADIAGGAGIVLIIIHAVVQHQILRASLHIHFLPPTAGSGDLRQRGSVGEMDDDHRDVHRLGDAQQAAYGLRLQNVGTGLGVGGNAHLPFGLFLLDEGVDNAAVFAVDAADAALFLELFQSLVHGLVPDHHGGVGHVHLEGGDAGGVHIVDLPLDVLVPVVDGHVEAVVAPALTVGLFVPKVQTVVQRLPLVGAGEVHHGGGAAPDGGPGAGVKIVGGKEGLQPVEKTVIDRCVRLVYRDYLADPKPEKMPILEDLYNALLKQEEKEAHYIATALEIYVTGSLNVFNHRTNVDIHSRIVSYDIKELGKQLKKIGMLIVQDQVWNRVTVNREAHKSTRYYIDEMHLLLKEEQTAAYSVEIWKRFRKWGGIPTGITQNVKDLLSSREVENIFENSDYIYMLNQASGDRQILAKHLNISPHQLSYVTHSGEGEGLLFYGSVILPFVDRFPKDTELYRIMTTKPQEQAEKN